MSKGQIHYTRRYSGLDPIGPGPNYQSNSKCGPGPGLDYQSGPIEGSIPRLPGQVFGVTMQIEVH